MSFSSFACFAAFSASVAGSASSGMFFRRLFGMHMYLSREDDSQLAGCRPYALPLADDFGNPSSYGEREAGAAAGAAATTRGAGAGARAGAGAGATGGIENRRGLRRAPSFCCLTRARRCASNSGSRRLFASYREFLKNCDTCGYVLPLSSARRIFSFGSGQGFSLKAACRVASPRSSPRGPCFFENFTNVPSVFCSSFR